jgi:Uma2 family endonuclease
MAIPVSYPAVWDDQEFYPLHEEDDVPEIPPHRRWVTYLYNALEARFPAWFVTSNVLIYWEPGNREAYRAPDLLVVKEPLAEAVDRVYQTWKQPPVTFVAEIGSRSTVRVDEGPKVEIYQDQVRAAEYYYADPPKGDQRLWRLGPDGYEAVAPEANGRLRSAELGLEFGLDAAGHLWLYTPEGERLLSHVETDAAWQEAERRRQEAERLQQEEAQRRQQAERLQQEEAQRRQQAERLQQEEAQRRQQAERRQHEEAQRRETAEARAAELERQLAELRERLVDLQ